jgi:hypothetical protein
LLATFQLALLAFGDAVDLLYRYSERAYDFRVQHTYAAARQRSERQFLLTGSPQFADDKHIEWSAKASRYLVPDRHTTTRQRQHNHAWIATESRQSARQNASGLASVLEDRHGRAPEMRKTAARFHPEVCMPKFTLAAALFSVP